MSLGHLARSDAPTRATERARSVLSAGLNTRRIYLF
jgi:hypothetical protein